MLFTLKTHSALETKLIAEKLAKILRKGDVITLDGDLGAGKTTFVQGLGLGLGIKANINSPTFNILKCYYSGKLPLYHIDAYRLEDNINADIGLEEVIEGDGIAVVEWSKFILDKIYQPLKIEIKILNNDEREFIFSSEFEKYRVIFDFLEEYKNEL